jgi:hypothetical protein
MVSLIPWILIIDQVSMCLNDWLGHILTTGDSTVMVSVLATAYYAVR